MKLRRTTTNALLTLTLAADVAGLLVALHGLVTDRALRAPSMLGAVVVVVSVLLFSGERLSGESLLFATVFGLALVCPLVALAHLHRGAGLPDWAAFGAGLLVFALHVLVLVRAIIASGSADDPDG